LPFTGLYLETDIGGLKTIKLARSFLRPIHKKVNCMNSKKLNENVGQYVKYILKILLLAFVGSFILVFLLEILEYEKKEFFGINSFYVLWGIWLVLLHLYLLNTEPIENTREKETVWEARSRHAGELCGLIFMGFLYAMGSLMVLGILLKLTLEIDIGEFDNIYRLALLAWAGWTIGIYLNYKHQDKKRLQEQLELLRQGKSVSYPHPKLIEERGKEEEANERTEAKERIGRILTDTEWEEVKSFRDKQREVLKKEREERVPSAFVLENFKWLKKRQIKNEKEYGEFLKGYEITPHYLNKKQESETKQSSSSKRILIPLSLSAEEALASVKAHLGDKKQELETESMSNLEKSDPDKNYMEYKGRFDDMTDGQLMDAFNREVGNSGWTSSRSSYLVALREEFEKRKIVVTDKKVLVNEPLIPEGLSKCKKCGEYKGEVKEKDLNWGDSFKKVEAEKSEEYLTVSCLCDGILCQICKKNKIHRPISNSYDEKDNHILHHPYFTGMMGCGECREKNRT
jgi:hypothetical protein